MVVNISSILAELKKVSVSHKFERTFVWAMSDRDSNTRNIMKLIINSKADGLIYGEISH